VTLVPQTVDRWLGPLQLFDASGLGLSLETPLAVLALQWSPMGGTGRCIACPSSGAGFIRCTTAPNASTCSGRFCSTRSTWWVHHQRGVRAYNYADFSIVDILFGTFRNPETWREPAGFYDGVSQRVGEMLIGRDVSEPPATEPRHWPQPEAARAQLGS
jgi:hypothetical protein